MKASFVACSFAGITYVPIDYSMPKERIDNIINQVEPSFAFDVSVADTYLSVVNGATYYMIEDEIKQNFKYLFEKLRVSNTQLAVMTPSFANYLLLDKSFNSKLLHKLKNILFCGEKLNIFTVNKLK